MLKEAEGAASHQHNVLRIFGASWCDPCHLLNTFLADPAISPIFDRNFVKLDVIYGERSNDIRHQRKDAEARAIALTSPLPFLTSAIFVLIALELKRPASLAHFGLAVEIWLIGPLPLILTNAAFMKLHRIFVASYAPGWLVKLLLVAAALSFFGR